MQFPWQNLLFEISKGLTAICLLGKELHWFPIRNMI